MSRKKRGNATQPTPTPLPRHDHARPGIRGRTAALAALALIALIASVGLWWTSQPAAPVAVTTPVIAASAIETAPNPPAAQYIGRTACASCHAEEDRLWRGSHHDLAMQEATTASVLGDFNNAAFEHHGVESRFSQRDGTFFVRTDGPDGELSDYAIKYAFGVWPMQQYLIEFPGGRLQALSIAWDARDKEDGGQRWFHLYPGESIDHDDPLHWTGLYQNWNMQCAACHSTNLKKGYDATSNSYKTSYSELNVSCEACHGPGSAHAAWASRAKAPHRADDVKGFALAMHSRWDEAWKFPAPGAHFARRDRPADAAVMNTCAACHARRSTLSENTVPGAPLADSHRLALPTPPLYHADGQQHDEVYVWGSFLQSRMYQQGVTCTDCHEPHTQKLRAEGNALCVRCHDSAQFDNPSHHFHTPGAQCVECHMPEQNYMVIDARRDHSIRLPRPDLSHTLGSPNACTQCHADKQPEWAATALDRWYGKAWRERPHYGTVLHAGVTQGVAALPSLLTLAQDNSSPALVRASAAALLQPHMRPDLLPMARALLRDTDPQVRISALELIEPADPVNRVLAAAPLLEDPLRGVRIEAARILADVPDAQFPSARRAARTAAQNEYIASLQQESDWPAANASLGNLYLRMGRVDQAIAAYERALQLDRQFIGAYVNLADAYRAQGRDDLGEQLLLRGLAVLPQNADLRHVLGLLLVRKGDSAGALAELEQAARLAPDNVRYAYVHAVALHSAGQSTAAIAVLRDADRRHPNDPDTLATLVSMYRESGDIAKAVEAAKQLAALLPHDPGAQQLLRELQESK